MTPTISTKMAETLISKMAHDLASPAGATVNGLELLEEDAGDMMQDAIALVAQGANAVATRLKIYRMAYGTAAGASGYSVAQINQLFQEHLKNGSRTKLEILPSASLVPDILKKMLINVVLCGLDSLPLGGTITAEPSANQLTLTITSVDPSRLPNSEALVIYDAATVEPEDLTPYNVQAWYTGFYGHQQRLIITKHTAANGSLVISVNA
jgi:histidine phosphotransferase ChpT